MDGELHVIVSLYDALERQPANTLIHERILEVWKDLGDDDMAAGTASVLLDIDPTNEVAKSYQRQKVNSIPPAVSPALRPSLIRSAKTQRAALNRLGEDYTVLKVEAKLLHQELEAILKLEGVVLQDEDIIANLKAISDGHVSIAASMAQPAPVRETVRAIVKKPNDCQELILEDFETFVRWATYQNPPLNADVVREMLVKRKTLFEAALPESMTRHSAAALANVERDFLSKKYVNSETMLGDKVVDIPKSRFVVTEDNYAWDMDELAQAIAANDGVMRNPLSKKMFSESDIRTMLAHPLGQRLKPLQMAQSELKKGVRQATIEHVGKLGRVMLEVSDVDTTPIRDAIDEFEAYVATIPAAEQNTIKSLKIPAKDGFSGQAFDYSIGESVRDAKANTTCFHKAGDFLSQAAVYLRSQ